MFNILITLTFHATGLLNNLMLVIKIIQRLNKEKTAYFLLNKLSKNSLLQRQR